MERSDFVIICLIFLTFGLFSKKLKKTMITVPMAFVFFGILFGPRFFNLIHLKLGNEVIRIIAELTLVLVLFTDAARINLFNLKKDHNLPIRLLSVGLILTIVFGAILAYLFFPSLTFWESAILATVLAPTDAALSHVVVSKKTKENGLVLPIIMILISFASVIDRTEPVSVWAIFIAKQLGFGVLVGLIVGFLGGRLYQIGDQRKWMGKTFEKLFILVLALLTYSLSSFIGGNGFLAAFLGGLSLGKATHSIKRGIQEFAATEGFLLSLLLYLFFGAIFAGPLLNAINGYIILYAILSLTIIRMLPVWLSLIGCRLRWESIFYIGWFGPRGIASIVFALMVLEDPDILQKHEIFLIATTTILLSFFAHGLTSLPFANWYAERTKKKAGKKWEEHKSVGELPVRIPHD